MFQDFAKRKFRDYISMLEFPAGRITFEKIWSSPLPPFIISFLENYIPSHNKPIDKKEFEDVLDKAIAVPGATGFSTGTTTLPGNRR